MKPTISEITNKWIADEKPCPEALEWWDKKEKDTIRILELLMKAKRYDWANWYIVRIMTYADYVAYAIFSAEQVIGLYEKKYPYDKRPRNALEAARLCIKNPTPENKNAAYAAYAANAAANAAAYSAADAAAYAAYAAGDAAYAETKERILKYGIALLRSGVIHDGD